MIGLSARHLSTASKVGIIMGLLGIVLIPIVVFASWLGVATWSRKHFPGIQGKRVALLIAHCDDEAMFFSPTVLGLNDPKLNNHLQILCLSPG
jgi:N-acetylglucosaminylphosphatidylinositol deacetylase